MNDGGLAYPSVTPLRYNTGVSRLEWYARAAMKGLLGRPISSNYELAEDAFTIAQAMLDEHERLKKALDSKESE